VLWEQMAKSSCCSLQFWHLVNNFFSEEVASLRQPAKNSFYERLVAFRLFATENILTAILRFKRKRAFDYKGKKQNICGAWLST
jgi:hypothetical protein